MKLPNWFKITWWLVLTGLVTSYLVARYSDLVAGKAVPLDVVVFLIWVGLLLAPTFQEVELLGFRFKQTAEKIREEFKSELQSVRALAQAAVIEPALDGAIREVYAVSSAAIHAEDVSQAQVNFVREVGPQLLATLSVLGAPNT
jgi:hypothetical protein